MTTGGIFILNTNAGEKFTPMLHYTNISVNEIIPGLWLGNYEASQSQEFLRIANIGTIINMTKTYPNTFESDSIQYLRVPINDPGPTNSLNQIDNTQLYEQLPFLVEFIHDKLSNNENVLVHCRAGISRSPSLVLAYLLKYIFNNKFSNFKKMRLKYALRCLLTNRPPVFYYGYKCNFDPAITQYLSDSN